MKNLLLFLSISLTVFSCKPTIQTTGYWVNREKLPPEPLKSVFIIAFTDNRELRLSLENDLAAAAEKRGMKAYKSMQIIGSVDIKQMAPVKDVFLKKLHDLNCESVFTVALVNQISETRYVSGSSMSYSPYGYGGYGYAGYPAYGPYGGFGGYYGYVCTTISSPGYYTTDNKYFIEGKLFDLKTDELLLSIQSKAKNPESISEASKSYTEKLMEEIKGMNLRK